MLPELSHFALALALCIALVLGTLPLLGAARGHAGWMALARSAARAQFVFVAIAFFGLMASFARLDFSLRLVVQHANTELPMAYRLAATWGSHEGSMLLWAFMLAGWTLAVSLWSRPLPPKTVARVLGVMGLLSVGFLLFILLTSNPFERLQPPALEGRDLNPLLQDVGMVIHPPMLYMGYVGFAVAFAFAVAALLEGRFDAAWARWSRPWTAAAWCFLSLGILFGSAWAYYELGWGGWWFWDPVENASFMPWLLGTALLHSLAVAEKRGAFKAWTLLLAIGAFSFSLLGTFIVRSGVLASVHAFATDPARGVFILGFLALTVGGSLALYAWRAQRIGFGGRFELVSRESMLLANNVMLSVAAGTVMLGTLYPMLLDALGLGKISVGPPYFESVFVPLMVPALLLMVVGPLLRWRSDTPDTLVPTLKWAALCGVAAGLLARAIAGPLSPGVWGGLFLGAWVCAGSVLHLGRRMRGGAAGLARVPRSVWAMALAHLGVGVFVCGVTLVRGFETEHLVELAPGEAATRAGYRYTLRQVREVEGPNYVAAQAEVQVMQDPSGAAFTLRPEKRLYRAQRMPTTEAAIDVGFTRDLYLALGPQTESARWTLRIHHKPFVDWIWGGVVLMAMGGALAASDRRYRRTAMRTADVAAWPSRGEAV